MAKPKFKATWYSFLPANKEAWRLTWILIGVVVAASVLTALLLAVMK